MRGRLLDPGAALLAVAAVLVGPGAARADDVVQFPLEGVLDGRPVSTLTGGVEVPWTTGIDLSDGFVTNALATHLGQAGPALPDDGTFAANADHPLVVLHFSNAAAAKAPQAHLLPGAGTIEFATPAATYSKVYLLLTSSRGDSTLNTTLFYADGTTTFSIITLPDWGTGKPLPTAPPIFFNLVSGLHKWNAQDQSTDTPSHGITGVVLTPAAGKMLRQIQLAQTGAMPYLTLWGATGVATSAVGPAAPLPDGAAPGDAAADGGASDVIASGAGGAAGTGGAAGMRGAAGGGASIPDARPSDAGAIVTPGDGAAGAGASSGSGGAGGTAAGAAGAKSGCACALDERDAGGSTAGWLLALGLVVVARRRAAR